MLTRALRAFSTPPTPALIPIKHAWLMPSQLHLCFVLPALHVNRQNTCLPPIQRTFSTHALLLILFRSCSVDALIHDFLFFSLPFSVCFWCSSFSPQSGSHSSVFGGVGQVNYDT